jgi:truncated hemoglobin YjbI
MAIRTNMSKNYTDTELEDRIYKITARFYELAYQDPWLGEVFKVVPQEFITSQQTDFMLGLFGGPKRYSGRHATDAHPHIFINEEMWQQREFILKRAMQELNAPQDISEKWLKMDEAFKKAIIMKDPSECKRRFPTDDLIIVPKPCRKAA